MNDATRFVVAFDNTAEMEAEMVRLNHQLRDRKRAGSSEDVEWISAVFQHAGYKEDMAAQRLAWDVLRRLGRLPQGWCE
jgi:DNA-binding protein H-NS